MQGPRKPVRGRLETLRKTPSGESGAGSLPSPKLGQWFVEWNGYPLLGPRVHSTVGLFRNSTHGLS